MIDIDINNQIMLGIAAFVILLLLGNVLYIILKDRKKDKEEIDDIMASVAKKENQSFEKVEEKKVELKEVPTQIIETKEEEPQVDFIEKKSEIEEMLEKMQQDLEAKSEDVVETFEKEQEEKSIISYQELVKTIHKDNAVNKIEVEEPVIETTVQEESTPATQNLMNEKIELTENKPKETEAVKKFKNTDFISPIYGKMEEHFEYPKVPSFHSKEKDLDSNDIPKKDTVEDVIEAFDKKLEEHQMNDYLEDFGFHTHMKIDSLEQTLDMPPISPEIKANEEFLQALKEFRKNLE